MSDPFRSDFDFKNEMTGLQNFTGFIWWTRNKFKTFMSIVDSILSTSSAAAQGLLQAPILIHGGEGKDITLVITSVVQVILLPECKIAFKT